MDVEHVPPSPADLGAVLNEPLAVVHASMDRMWAEWIHEQLERAGIVATLSRYTNEGTTSLAAQLESGLRRFSRLVVIFSAPFMVSVAAPDAEWAEAITRARVMQDRLIPVLIGRCALPTGFWQLAPINLFGVNEEAVASERLLRRVVTMENGGTGHQNTSSESGFVRYPGRAPELVNAHLPSRNPQFTGRLEHLDQIRALLTGNRVSLMPNTLYGLGGVGKTELAKEYAHRFGADYDLIWWIRAESRAAARASLAELGARLGADPTASRGECIRHAHEALRRGTPYSRWLLVFDNADDISEALDLLPASSSCGHVLITSRNLDWRDFGASVMVEVYPRRESIEFLRRKVPDISIENANGFADSVQDLPLALEHAASWYRETGRSAAEYRELMESEFRILFADRKFYPVLTLGDGRAEDDDGSEPDAGYVRTVASAWLVSAQTMADDQRNPARKLLEFLSFFAPVPVPLDLMRAAPAGLLPRDLELHLADDVAIRDMFRAIATRSLARVYAPAEGNPRDMLEMHRIVQLFIANSISTERADRYRRAARMALVATAPEDPEAPRNFPAYAEIIPHLAPTGAMRSLEEEVLQLILDISRSLLRQGEYDSCLTLVRRALSHWSTVLEPADEMLLTLRRSESLALSGLGDQVSRLAINRDVLRLATAVHGEDSPVALRARGSIAAALLWLGRVTEAEEVARAVLETTRAEHGEEAGLTLRAICNYAAHLRLAGRHEEALELDRAVYRLRSASSSGAREVIIARTSLARDLRELGLAFEAAQEQEDNYGTSVMELGRYEPETLRAMEELAIIRRFAGRYEEAYELGLIALERSEAQLGQEHPDYIGSLANLAGYCRFLGETNRGRRLARDAYEKAQRIIPAPNPIRAATATNLAVFLRADGELEEATDLDRQAFEELRGILGDGNHCTLACQINLANDMALSQDLEGAKRLHSDAWNKLAELRGIDHPQTVLARMNLDLARERLGEIGPEVREELIERAEEQYSNGRGMTPFERAQAAAREWLSCDIPLPLY